MANLAICLLTYERTDYALKTLTSTLEKLTPQGKIHVHIADDGSHANHRSVLYRTALEYVPKDQLTITNAERGGYGRNVNLATQVLHSIVDYILMLEDDWELTKVFNPYELIEDIDGCYADVTHPRFDCVRLGYLSFTQPLLGQVVDRNNRKYLLLDANSAEPHVWAGHPRLETVQRQRDMGEWPEGELPGATEFIMAHRRRVRLGVAWPMDLVHPYGSLFAHIGTQRSY